MLHIDSVIDRPAETVVPAAEPKIAVTETVTVVQKPSEQRGFLLRESDSEWSWSDLRDYVVAQIEERFGPQPRDHKKEYGIFNRFFNSFGANAVAIARYAFEVENGWWMSAPIRVTRFTKGSDPYFAQVILSRLQS